MRIAFVLLFGLCNSLLFAQSAETPKDWFHKSPSDGFPGIGSESLYDRLPKGVSPDTVVVAVIDGGVDYMHEDLKNVMWVNKDEIPGNGIDDDNNGYIDDIHGWNFIGNAKGENVHYDNLEVARLYAKLREKYADVDPERLNKKEMEEYELYLKVKEETEEGREKFKQNFELYSFLSEAVEKLNMELKDKEEISADDLRNLSLEDPRLKQVSMVIAAQMDAGVSYEEFTGEIQRGYEYFAERYKYNFNPDYDSRKYVDDNLADKYERYYGNPDVKGPDASHGTHVAGIIAAERNNDIGIDGVANAVKIMAIRAVPGGDERDKDVANAIYYAVDNGASIINMSFGKGYSPYKEVVDKAVKYAAKNDVLLVHAAGNDGNQIDENNNFPTDKFLKRGFLGPKHAKNWIEVGALSYTLGEGMPASFSNYSPDYVDVFAPGDEIYSTTPENTYESYPGTSMAAPMVAGIAAVLRSYFPDLKAEQVKEIIQESTVKKSTQMVVKPGTEEKVPFSALSVSGGIVNLGNAVELATQTKGKKRGKKDSRKLEKLPVKPKA